MNDLYSFFRYTLPGVVFLFEIALSLVILFPSWVKDLIFSASAQSGQIFNTAIGLILATFTALALGYLFTVFYRAFTFFLIDYSVFLEDLLKKGIISKTDLIDSWQGQEGREKKKTAWIIISALWFERAESSPKIKGAVERTQGLSHLLNSSAAVFTGSIFAAGILFVICAAFRSNTSIFQMLCVFIFIVGAAYIQWRSGSDAKNTLAKFCELVLLNTLQDEYNDHRKARKSVKQGSRRKPKA